MVKTSIKTLGFTINVNVPSSVEEYDTAAKSVGACLDSAIKNVLYRSVLATFRDTFTERLAKQTGIERETKVVRTKTVKGENGAADSQEDVLAWNETEGAYFARVVAALGQRDGSTEDAVIASLVPLADEVAASLVFDPSERESVPSGPKKTAKVYTDAATQIVNAGKADVAAAKLGALLGRVVGTSIEDLANAIRDKKRLDEKNLANEFTS
jgi:hypothetical protein